VVINIKNKDSVKAFEQLKPPVILLI